MQIRKATINDIEHWLFYLILIVVSMEKNTGKLLWIL